MPPRHAICLCLDGLRASALGTYGNTIHPTPHFDALASRSSVVDWLIADSPTLSGFYRSAAYVEHALRRTKSISPLSDQKSALEQFTDAGVRSLLISDESWLCDQEAEFPFEKIIDIENSAENAAEDIETTCLGRFFSNAIEQIQRARQTNSDESSLIWLHSRGMVGPWDAPKELRDQLLDDEDPPLEDFVAVPKQLRGIEDPDQLLAYRVAYAAQMTVLDCCLGALVDVLQELFIEEDTLLMVFGSRGMPLGEHQSVGVECQELYSEQLHLPWLIHPLGNTVPLPRQTAIAQPADLGVTLLDWFGLADAENFIDGYSRLPGCSEIVDSQRKLAFAVGQNNDSVVRTPAWSLIQTKHEAESSEHKLFTKPDDRWESNDISGLCPEVVEKLSEELDRVRKLGPKGEPLPRVPESPELMESSR